MPNLNGGDYSELGVTERVMTTGAWRRGAGQREDEGSSLLVLALVVRKRADP